MDTICEIYYQGEYTKYDYFVLDYSFLLAAGYVEGSYNVLKADGQTQIIFQDQ